MATLKRENVNSLFGSFTVEESGKVDYTYDEDTVTDYILRTGIDKKIQKTSNELDYLNNAPDYVDHKTKDLVKIVGILEKYFQHIYVREYRRGLSNEQTEKNIKQAMEEEKNKLMKFHAIDFPDELSRKICKKKFPNK